MTCAQHLYNLFKPISLTCIDGPFSLRWEVLDIQRGTHLPAVQQADACDRASTTERETADQFTKNAQNTGILKSSGARQVTFWWNEPEAVFPGKGKKMRKTGQWLGKWWALGFGSGPSSLQRGQTLKRQHEVQLCEFRKERVTSVKHIWCELTWRRPKHNSRGENGNKKTT